MFYPTDHTVACQAYAMKCAVENYRDTEGVSKLDFRFAAQDGTFLRMADDYLADGGGMMRDVCKCHIKCMAHIRDVFSSGYEDRAQSLAKAYLDNREISPENYITILHEIRNSAAADADAPFGAVDESETGWTGR